MSIEELYKLYQQHPSVQTDTRKLRNGDLFFALKGPNYNANTFAEKAIHSGAVYAIVDEKEYATKENIIFVDDVLVTLQELALYHRQQFKIPFIAITGTNGKTTTKELIHSVLSTTYRCYTTTGNLNNHIGVPLTILNIGKDAEIAVIEMGANHQKEIESYCRYTLPTHGLITNCGKAHLEGFGGPEGVKKGKGELFDFLRGNKGSAFVMWDYDYLQEMSTGIPEIITYGTHDANITGIATRSEPFLSVEITGSKIREVQTQLVGAYNLPNVIAAIAVGKHFKVKDEHIKNAIESYQPTNSRSQLIEFYSNKIILDAYNANPSSMKAAIENFAAISVKDKVLILGGMAELGAESIQEHRDIIEMIKNHSWKNVLLVGGDFQNIDHPFQSFTNSSEAGQWFKAQHFEDTHFLIKGSRSMKMEKVLDE